MVGLIFGLLAVVAFQSPARAQDRTACLRTAVGQALNKPYDGSDAQGMLQELQRRLGKVPADSIIRNDHTIYVACWNGDVVTVVPIGGAAKSELLNSLRETATLAWSLAKLGGLDKALTERLGQKRLGARPSLISVGSMTHPLGYGAYSAGWNLSSLRQDLSTAMAAASLVHEWSHMLFALRTGRAAPKDERSGQPPPSMVELVINEAHSYAYQFGAVHGMSLVETDNPYRRLLSGGTVQLQGHGLFSEWARASAAATPTLATAVRDHGRLPPDFLARLFKRLIVQPNPVHMERFKQGKLSPSKPAAIDGLLKHVDFLDAAARAEMKAAILGSTWFAGPQKPVAAVPPAVGLPSAPASVPAPSVAPAPNTVPVAREQDPIKIVLPDGRAAAPTSASGVAAEIKRLQTREVLGVPGTFLIHQFVETNATDFTVPILTAAGYTPASWEKAKGWLNGSSYREALNAFRSLDKRSIPALLPQDLKHYADMGRFIESSRSRFPPGGGMDFDTMQIIGKIKDVLRRSAEP